VKREETMPILSDRSVIPTALSAWPGSSNPVSGGMAVSPDPSDVGTLGLALTIRGVSYLTTCRHVAGLTATDGGVGVALWTPSQTWARFDGLRLIPERDQPGVRFYEEVDTSFLRADVATANATPGGDASVAPQFLTPAVGTTLQFRGCRDDRWRSCVFAGMFNWTLHGAAFSGAPNILDFTALGVVNLDPNHHDPNDLAGDSGTAVWARTGLDEVGCIGHLMAASAQAPLGMVVLYEQAFSRLHLSPSDYTIP
jgi:hypothetical protein